MTMLNLIQQWPRIRNELSRRIGYTNGLHDIFRFARVVRYLVELGPAPSTALRSAILANENVAGAKYVDGVIEVGRALGLIHKAGTNLTPADKGFALYAVEQYDGNIEAKTALLLNAVLEADGDATLNLLDLMTSSDDIASHGETLVSRLIKITDIRIRWTEHNINDQMVRNMVIRDLNETKARLTKATDPGQKRSHTWSSYREERRLTSEQRVNRFYEHTINPRRGWLKDLGCIRSEGKELLTLTSRGRRLLNAFKTNNCYTESGFVLPFSTDVERAFGITTSREHDNIFWSATASFFKDRTHPTNLPGVEMFRLIQSLYPYVKLHVFNEAAVESIYTAMSAILALNGQHMSRSWFNKALNAVSREYPDRIYLLGARQERTSYIALRS